MVEGSNICDLGHRDQAPVPLLSLVYSGLCVARKGHHRRRRALQLLRRAGDWYRQSQRLLHALKGMVFDQQRMSYDELIQVLKANFQTPEGEKIRARPAHRFEKIWQRYR